MTDQAPEVSVVVPCHRAAGTVELLLDALEAQTFAPTRFEVVLVDAGLDDTERVVARRRADWRGAPVRIVRCTPEGGPASKRNRGTAEARAGVVAFTDADCLPTPNWLELGMAAMRDADVVQGSVFPPEGQRETLLAHAVAVGTPHGLFETSNIFYRRNLLRDLDGFSTTWFERFGRPFGEDAELGWRALRHGARFRFAAEARVEHPVTRIGLRAHLSEQWLARGFPALARAAPELRDRLFYRRMFLSRDSCRFLLALLGVASRRRGDLGLALAAPYVASVARQARHDPVGAALRPLSDGVLMAALVSGSVRARSPVL